MSNILFIVCPFSMMEYTLKRKFGSNCFFLSCPGAIIPYNDECFINVMKESLIINNITCIYFVNDTSCIILNNIILNKPSHGLEAEYLVNSLYYHAANSNFKSSSLLYQQFKLAELNLHSQKEAFLSNGLFTNLVIDQKIKIKTLVTNKALRIFKESRISSSIKKTYEL